MLRLTTIALMATLVVTASGCGGGSSAQSPPPPPGSSCWRTHDGGELDRVAQVDVGGDIAELHLARLQLVPDFLAGQPHHHS